MCRTFLGVRESIKNEILPTTAQLNIFLLLSHPFLFLLLFSYSFFTIIPFVYIYGSDSARKMKNDFSLWSSQLDSCSRNHFKIGRILTIPSYWCSHWKQIILQILLSQKPASELAGQFYLYVQACKRHQLWLPHGPIIPVDDHITPHKTNQLSDFLSQEYKYEINYLIPSFSWLTSGLLWIFLCPHSSVVLVPLWQKVQSCQ